MRSGDLKIWERVKKERSRVFWEEGLSKSRVREMLQMKMGEVFRMRRGQGRGRGNRGSFKSWTNLCRTSDFVSGFFLNKIFFGPGSTKVCRYRESSERNIHQLENTHKEFKDTKRIIELLQGVWNYARQDDKSIIKEKLVGIEGREGTKEEKKERILSQSKTRYCRYFSVLTTQVPRHVVDFGH